MSITNATLATKINDLVQQWEDFQVEQQAWMTGVVGGGPNLDGQYPLTDYIGDTVLATCPLQLEYDVQSTNTGAVASAAAAAASAAAALASEVAAALSEVAAAASEGNALTYQNAALQAQADAESARTVAIAQAAAALASAAAALASETAAALSETNAGASETAAAASAAAALASEIAAAASAASIDYSWTSITGKPTTIAGFGITDAYTKTESDAAYEPIDATILKDADIGVTVQAYDADLTTWAGITPSANAQSLVSAATYAAMRTLLDLEAGTDFYSISAADAAFAPISHSHVLTDVTDVTALAAELNLLDLSGLTAGWVLSADTATTASWKAPTGGLTDVSSDLTPELGGELYAGAFNIKFDNTYGIYASNTAGNANLDLDAETSASGLANIRAFRNGATSTGGVQFTLYKGNTSTTFGRFAFGVDSREGLSLINDAALHFEQRAAADSPTANYGQVWVKNTDPPILMFTDEAGFDFEIRPGEEKYKTADQTVNNSTTLVTDTHMTGFAMDPASYYKVEGFLDMLTNATADFKFQLTTSQTPVDSYVQINGKASSGSGGGDAGTANSALFYASATASHGIQIAGFIQTHATLDSTLDLQWAQWVAAVTNTTVGNGSWIKITKMG